MNLSTQDIHIMLSIKDMDHKERTSMDNLRQRMEKLGWKLNNDDLLLQCETLRTKRMIDFSIQPLAGGRVHIKDRYPLNLTYDGESFLHSQ